MVVVWWKSPLRTAATDLSNFRAQIPVVVP
jgi:hypothetical protein